VTKDAGALDHPARDAAAPRRTAAIDVNGNPYATMSASTPPPPKPAGTDVHQLLLQDTPSSIAAARSILEPKVFGNRATAEEIRMLKTICKSQHDEVCVEKCKSLLGQ
jgi:hypothetical protein